MEVFPVLGKLLLLFSVIWTCSGDQRVYVRCSPSWFFAKVKRTAFDNTILMLPEEVFLGNHCPVVEIHQESYIFIYPTSECDIRTQILPGDLLLFESEIIFESMFTELRGSIPVTCVVPRHPVAIKNKGHHAHEETGSPEGAGVAHLDTGETINYKLEIKIPDLKAALSPPEFSVAFMMTQRCGYSRWTC